jgi:hypothetical protein
MHGMNIKLNPLNAELNPICHLLALLGGATIVDVSRLRVKLILLLLENFDIDVMLYFGLPGFQNFFILCSTESTEFW